MKKNDIAPFYQSFGASFKESLLLRKRVQKEGEHNWQQIAAIKVERGDESVSGANYRQNPLVLQHLAHFCQMWDTFANQGTILHQVTTKNTLTV